MLGNSLASSFLTYESATLCSTYFSDLSAFAPNCAPLKLNISHRITPNAQSNVFRQRSCKFVGASRNWGLHSVSQTQSVALLENEERKMWDSCRQALSTLKFSVEEADVILSKAFGWAHSPYWGEERVKEVPKGEMVNGTLDYLRNLGLSDDDLYKLLKKFPEVCGCSLNDELKMNVATLEKEWGIKGTSLRSLLLRNPKVLGYNVDCKGDCMAQCTRCWVRF
ncbi:mitochondrial transcription termination factor family protein [Tasmannia lanceolata]|uniref:mitochondrial transcription termination factor family protein n=1 Tax=Tasmannia lanceolata TaxID=3420 RepID=UPI004062DF7E